MSSPRTIRFGCLLGLLLLSLLEPRVAAAQVSWVLNSSLPGLNAQWVWAASPTDVFASGGIATVDQFNGASWTQMSLPPGTNRYGIFGTAANNIYSAGQYGYQTGALFHYDGTSWTTAFTTDETELTDAWADDAGDAFATGDGRFFINHGAGWFEVATGLSHAFNTDRLSGIWGTDYDNVYAVGYGGLIAHWDGLTLTYSQPFGNAFALSDIFGFSADDIYATGTNGTLLHFDGSTWSKIDVPTTGNLFGIYGFSPDDLYVVGDGGIMFRYDGVAWTLIPTPTTRDLFDMWGAQQAGEDFLVIAAANAGGSGTILEGSFAAQGAVVTPEPTPVVLLATGMMVLLLLPRSLGAPRGSGSSPA